MQESSSFSRLHRHQGLDPLKGVLWWKLALEPAASEKAALQLTLHVKGALHVIMDLCIQRDEAKRKVYAYMHLRKYMQYMYL